MKDTTSSPSADSHENILRMTEEEFNQIAQLVYNQFGINLTAGKKILAESRLNSILRKRKIPNFSTYLDILKRDTSGQELIELANKISTNHTYFYREDAHFKYMQTHILPALFSSENSDPEIRIWSAPCSSGEEAYTIAMTVHDYMIRNHLVGSKVIKILGTDISVTALEEAKKGVYGMDEIESLPKEWQKRYFTKINDLECQIVPGLRDWLKFGRLNFMDGEWPFKKKFHLIFCRNVMIYFDMPTKEALVRKFCRYLDSRDYFIISLSESLPVSVKSLFSQESSSVFRKL